MIRYLIGLGTGPVLILPMYFFSLRQTAEKKLWKLLSSVAFGASMIFGLIGIADRNVTLAGIWALTMIGVGPALMAVVGVEWSAVINGWGTKDFREQLAQRRFQRLNDGEWHVEAIANENDDALVEICVRKGSHSRPVGSADPIHESELFHEHKARGEEMAATLNGLKVKAPASRAIVAPTRPRDPWD